MNIHKLFLEKTQITKKLENIYYGSIEVREKESKKYIYTHFRNDGVLTSKYVGEYSNELYNLILENNELVRELKKRLKIINKELKFIYYDEQRKLSPKITLNIDIARRSLVDSIYKQAMLEGLTITYSDIEEIVSGGKVNNIAVIDIVKVVNLKHAWNFILNKDVIKCPPSYAILCQLNALVEEGITYSSGTIRSVSVKIGGSSYIPPIPFESQVIEELKEIVENKNVIDRAINSLLYIMKKQIFLDGNKRTAVLFANHILIANGKGLIVIPAEKVNEYKKLLVNYYETDNTKEIKKFLLDKCYLKI